MIKLLYKKFTRIKPYQVVILLCLIVFVVIFNTLFERIVHDYIAVPFFNNMGGNVKKGESLIYLFLTYVLLTTIMGGIYFYFFSKLSKQVIIHSFESILYLMVIFLYFLYRSHFVDFTPKYSYVLYPQNWFIKYTDIIVWGVFNIAFIPFLQLKERKMLYNKVNNFYEKITQFWKEDKKSSIPKTEGFIPDFVTDEDKLKRTSYAISVAKNIKNAQNDENALAIGIVGKWGSGKSSFMKQIETILEKEEDLIIITFNPWYSTTPSALTKDFFDVLKEALTPYDMRMKYQLDDYVQKIVSIEDVYAQILKIFVSDTSNEAQFEDIKNSINTIGKKIIVFIDDIDRLDKQEIVEVIRIIRNTAAFPHFVYIAAYDKNYVNEALKDLNPYQPETFLEKIFQVEITLPEYEEDVLEKMLINALFDKFKILEILNDADKNEMKNVINESSIWKEFIQTPRDIIRFVNILYLDYVPLHKRVDMKDFFHLTLMKFKYPNVYEVFAREYPQNINILEDEKLDIKFNIKEEDKIKLKRLSDNIFIYEDTSALLSISTISNRKRYFAYRLCDGDFDPIKLSELRNKYNNQTIDNPTKKFREELLKYQSDNSININILLDALYKINYAFDNMLDFENIVATIIFIEKQEHFEISIKTRYILNILLNTEIQKIIISLYEKANASDKELKEFLNFHVFTPSMSSFRWLKNILSSYQMQYTNQTFINMSEINDKYDVFYNYLIDNINNYEDGGKQLLELFYSQMRRNAENISKQNEIRKGIIKWMGKENIINDFLMYFISKNPFDNYNESRAYIVNKDNIEYIFITIEEFETFLTQYNDNELVKEFQYFLVKCKETNFRYYIKIEDLNSNLLFNKI